MVRGGGDRVCHHDGVEHIETEVVTVTVLVEIMLSLSVRTAVVERSASAMNNIKNHMRTTLQQNNHNHLMQIEVNGHSLDENKVAI